MMWLPTTLHVILLCQVAHMVHFYWSTSTIRYDDHNIEGDLYFDRLTGLVLNITNFNGCGLEKIVVAVGIWIASDRILTSYNPFRTFIHNKTMVPHLMTGALIGRKRSDTGDITYTTSKYRLACGRQVQYLSDEKITEDNLWHDHNKINCPLHDLSVFRIYGNATLSNWPTNDYTMAQHFPDGQESKHTTEIFLATLANTTHHMRPIFKFAHIENYFHVRVVTYDPDVDGFEGVERCDEWMPREWGHFICVRNKNNLQTMASGAMLVSNERVFGVGSFVLFRGVRSILVFTDVRPYYDQIFNTCTYNDSGEEPPTAFPLDD